MPVPHARAGAPLAVGVDRADITPARPVPLAGFESRAGLGAATGVSAPLRLRTLALATAAERAVFLSADLLWWGPDTTARVHRELADRYGLPAESVLLHATHNHSGPQTSHRFVSMLGEPDDGYLDQLCAAAADSVGRALAALTPVWVERATGKADLGVDRRSARTSGELAPAPIDTEVTALRFAGGDRTVALLVHYACHPVVHHGNVVTSDFSGAAMDQLEDQFPGAVAVYAQGCCGDVNPDLYHGGDFLDGDQSAVARLGGDLADAVTKALDGGCTPLGAIRLDGASRTVELPLAALPDRDELEAGLATPGVRADWARLLLDDPARLAPTAQVRLSRLRLADDLMLIGLSGEPVSAYGLHAKAVSAGAALTLGYTNGMTGYLVTARQLREGGYESEDAPYYFGMPAPFAPAAEDVLRRAIGAAVSD